MAVHVCSNAGTVHSTSSQSLLESLRRTLFRELGCRCDGVSLTDVGNQAADRLTVGTDSMFDWTLISLPRHCFCAARNRNAHVISHLAPCLPLTNPLHTSWSLSKRWLWKLLEIGGLVFTVTKHRVSRPCCIYEPASFFE